MMKWNFEYRLKEAGTNKEMLLKLMSDIDDEKRYVKSVLKGVDHDKDFETKEDKLSRKNSLEYAESCLKREREMVQHKIGAVNRAARAMNVSMNNGAAKNAAYVLAVKRLVGKDKLERIDKLAAEILNEANVNPNVKD